jgi:serine/threonine protein kinase/tetratricopeptide (TPR) repeat protein
MLTTKRREIDRRIDEVVEAFEQALADGRRADVRDFLPRGGGEDDRRVATELFCVDIHYRWQRGDRKSVAQYRREFADLLHGGPTLSDLAREEYRLRLQEGERVSPSEYRRAWNVDVAGWPVISDDGADTRAGFTSDDTGIESLGTELHRLADAVTELPGPGERFAEFELVEELGRGTFAVVYLARQLTLEGRPVVVKITPVSPLEAGFLSKLQHTNIVPIYSLHRALGVQAICMPFFGRRTLAHELAESHVPPRLIDERRAAEITLQIARGLEHAHERGIVHRDLKPANVLLADDGTAMVLDFNLSDDVVAGGKSCLMVGGTLPYLAPEHLVAIGCGHRVGPQADIYSLGVLLYQMLCHRLPFPIRRASFNAAVAQMIEDRQAIPSPRTFNPNVSSGLDSIVRRMLAPELSARYESMCQVADDLERHLSDRPLRFADDPSLGERVKKWSRRHPRISSATSILIASILLVFLLSTALVSRGHSLARQSAMTQLNELRRQMPEVRVLTSSLSGLDRSTLERGAAIARRWVDAYGVMENDDWRSDEEFAYLDSSGRSEVEVSLVQSLYSIASADILLAQGETDASRRAQRLEDARRANLCAASIGSPPGVSAILTDQNGRIEQMMSRNVATPDTPSSMYLPGSIDAQAAGASPNILWANSLLDSGRYEDAVEQLDELRRRDPYDTSVWFMLGQSYGALGRLADADACFSVCIAMWPDSYLGYFHRGRCRLDAQRYGDAAGDLAESLARNADYIPALINRAICLRELGKYTEAEADLTRAVELKANQTRIYLLRSEIRQRMGDAQGAAADRQLGMRLTPVDELSWISRGLARLHDEPQMALRDFQMATHLNPQSYAAWRNIAHIYAERLNRPEDALAVLNQLLEHSRQPMGDRVSRGVLSARLGKRPEAHEDARYALGHAPSAKELLQVACIYSLTSEPGNTDADVALDLLEQAVTREPRWLRVALSDPDLIKLRSHSAFHETVTRLRERIAKGQRVLAETQHE